MWIVIVRVGVAVVRVVDVLEVGHQGLGVGLVVLRVGDFTEARNVVVLGGGRGVGVGIYSGELR
jgi:hypothetical protein